jgi:hypothetical protein
MSSISRTTEARGLDQAGLTLAELALALLALGAVLALLAPWIGQRLRVEKEAEGRRNVAAARDHLIGWAMLQPAGAKRLPARSATGLPLDPWGRALVYVPDEGLTSGDLCSDGLVQTDLSLRLPESGAAGNVAFVVASRGPKTSLGEDHEYGGRPVDLSERRRDDLVEFVTLDQLKAYVCGR